MSKKKSTAIPQLETVPGQGPLCPDSTTTRKEIQMSEATVNVGGASVSESEVQAALDLLRRTKEQRTKQAQKVKDNPELKAKAAVRALRLRIKDTILKGKAVAAGLIVTDEEVDAYIAANKAVPAE